jgi:hypothetical protein
MSQQEELAGGERLLRKLIGKQVTSIIFVAGYLQIELDLYRLSFYSWPTLFWGRTLRYDLDSDYEHHLRKLISASVTEASVSNNEGVVIEFEEDVTLTLAPSAAPIGGIELLQYHHDPDDEWSVWRLGEPPFDAAR